MSALNPTKGRIELGYDKMNMKTLPIPIIRKHISFVNQNTKLFNISVFENMKYGNPNLKYKEVKKFIDSLNITLFDKLEHGLHTNSGINGDNLSGGQKQVIHLVRSYFKEAPIILMDEPLSAIDENNIQEIIDIISKISKDKTLIVVSHNDKIAPIITREIDVCNLYKK